jgi:hypothetical protein
MIAHQSYHQMVNETRNLAKYPVLARAQGFTEVGLMCTKLLQCAECPELDSSSFFTCSITKVQTFGAVRVNSSSEAVAVMVHPRFLRFCISFWFASRFEHVLRKLVRVKYSKAVCDASTLAAVSKSIYNDTDITVTVVENFANALMHVHRTMHHLLGTKGDAAYALSGFIIEAASQTAELLVEEMEVAV